MSRKSCQYGGCLLCGSQLRLKSLSVIIVIIKELAELVQTCVVHGCGSTSRPGGDIRFHAFPKNSTQRKLWLSIVPLKMKCYETVRICNLHFQESDYDSTTRRSKQTAFPAIITNQEAVSPCKIASSLHEDSMVQIATVPVPSTSSGTYESNSSHKEMVVKRAGCNIKDQTSKKQFRKFLGNISNLNMLPASQMHRDYYRGYPKSYHPLKYFIEPEYMWQCPPEMSQVYLSFPPYHVKYKQPISLPTTLERTLEMPELPGRTLAGRYNKNACKAFVR